MRVLFVVHSDYLFREPYRRVAARLRLRSVDSCMLYLRPEPLRPARAATPGPGLDEDNEVLELRVGPSGSPGVGLLGRALGVVGLVLGARRMDRLLHAVRPDVVVTGTDMGDVYVRVLMDACRRRQIPVVILGFVLLGPKFVNPDVDKGIPLARLARAGMRLLGLHDAVFYRGWVTGSYHPGAVIAVASSHEMAYLERLGIAPERLVLTGSPVHDQLHELRGRDVAALRAELCGRLGWAPNSRLVVYCTERIQDFYGTEYLRGINARLAESLARLPEECRLLIKLHPREPEPIAAMIGATFTGSRCAVVRDEPILPLLRCAHLTLSHWSLTLVDAALMGTPVLSIDIKGEGRLSLDFGPGDDLIRIATEADFAWKIEAMLYDEPARELAARLMQRWVEARGVRLDGRCAERIAALIAGER